MILSEGRSFTFKLTAAQIKANFLNISLLIFCNMFLSSHIPSFLVFTEKSCRKPAK